jgi:hypothetical protein
MTPLLRLSTLVVAALTMAASAVAPAALTLASTENIDFDDLIANEPVHPDRYSDRGLYIEIGPSGTHDAGDGFIGSGTKTPCNGTRSLQPVPFGGPSFLLRFPGGVTRVSLDAGDIGPSDTDEIFVAAFSDDSLQTIIQVTSATLPQDAPTGCVRLSVQAPTVGPMIIPIRAVEITSASFAVLSSNSPSGVSSSSNSISIDNVSFEHYNDMSF